MIEIFHWDDDKPHRCPNCYRVVQWSGKMSRWKLHQCPYCRLLFAWWAGRGFSIYNRRCPICGQTYLDGHYRGNDDYCKKRLQEANERGLREWQ